MSANPVLVPVTLSEWAMIAEYVMNATRNRKRVVNIYSVDDQLYADVYTRNFEPDEKTYRWTITERQIGGADVETASLREVEFVNGEYTETGDSL